MGPFAYPSRRASSVSSLSAYAAHDAHRSHRLAHRPAMRSSHRPSPRPPTRRAGRGACFPSGTFHVRTMQYNSPSLLIPTLIASPACPVAPYPSIPGGAYPSVGSDCGNGCCGSYRIGLVPICSAINPSHHSAPIRPAQSTRGTGRTTGRALFSCLVRASGLPHYDCVGVGDGSDCVSRLTIVDCLPAILRLPGNTLAVNAGRHGVGSQSGLIVSPPALYSLRFRILCPIAPPRCPVPSHPFRSPACFALIATLIAPCSHLPIIRWMPRGFPSHRLIADHATPIVSSRRGRIFQRHRIRCV